MQSLAIFLLAVSFAGIFAAPAENLVTSVPGFPGDLPFPAYSGYLPANDGGKMMFYFFSQSQNSPADDPVVLWLNGGPGCSSFDGFVYEHGPFTFNNGPMGLEQNLTLNPYSWTKVANVIYLDSPCGVGLSYSNNSDFIDTDDVTTAHDSHNFLLNFFAAYPEFQNNDFYIAGESYAGIYVPTLAQQVMLGNRNGKATKINMKGYLVGNGVTSEVYDGNSFLPFIYGHSLISNGQYQDVVEACGGVNIWNATGLCFDTLYNVSMNVAALNIYNIYQDCYNPNQTEVAEPSDDEYHVFNLWDRVTKRMRDETSGYKPAEGGQVPCINSDRASAWINTEEVRTALHAISVEEQPWYICVDLNYTSVYSTVVPIHKELIEAGYRALVYSGDIDMCVPNVGSEAWTDSLNLVVEDEWRPWFVNYQVAGYVRAYKGLTYATIKDSGHTVPEYKPEQALYFFTQFLNGESF